MEDQTFKDEVPEDFYTPQWFHHPESDSVFIDKWSNHPTDECIVLRPVKDDETELDADKIAKEFNIY